MKRFLALLGLLTLLVYAPASGFNPAASESLTVTPVLWLVPNHGNFGAAQVGQTATLSYILRNVGSSVLNIKKIEVVGECFSLTDTTHYPFEIIGPDGVAFSTGNSGKSISFQVKFTPTDVKVYTGKLRIIYDLYFDLVYEVPLIAEGLSCYTAVEAHIGENWAPKLNVWFKFTAEKFGIFEINTCHPNQPNPGNAIRYFFYGYSNCQGTQRLHGPEFETVFCPNDRYAAQETTVLYKGETIYLYWPKVYLNSTYDSTGFYFNIIVTYPTDGDVCENAIPLTLPVVNLFGNTRRLNDDYDQSPCSPFYNYMNGNDIVYTITLDKEGYLNGNIIGTFGSIHVLDICPKEELEKDHCKGFAGGPQGGSFRKKIKAGTYFVIVSNWSPPQSIDYLLNLSFEGISGIDDEDLANNLAVWPNPASDRLNVSVNQETPADLTFELMTLTGQVLWQKRVAGVFDYQDEIDVSRLARGFYYIRVNNGKELKIAKVVLE